MKKNRTMTLRGRISLCSVAAVAFLFSQSGLTWAQAVSPTKEASKDGALRDGQHDFDFAIGNWKFHLKKLEHPLTGSTTWWNSMVLRAVEKFGTVARTLMRSRS